MSSGDFTTGLATTYPNYDMYITRDGGDTFTLVTLPPNVPDQDFFAVSANSDGSKLVAVALGGFLWTTTDKGVTWIKGGDTNKQNFYGVSVSGDGNTILAAVTASPDTTLGGFLWISTDGGTTFVHRAFRGQWQRAATAAAGNHMYAAIWGGDLYTSP